MPEQIVKIAREVSEIVRVRVKDIQAVTRRTKIIAINAMVESARIGAAGKGFAVVASEVGTVSEEVNNISEDLESRLTARIKELDVRAQNLVNHVRGGRLVDLSVNMIDIIDRNLYERSCDVRWWATDSADVGAATDPSPSNCAFAGERLAVILKAYTVYVDIWLISPSGQVLANAASQHTAKACRENVANETWFKQAWGSRSGNDFAVADIVESPVFHQTVATYAAAVREGGKENGKPLGVLAIFFDWQKQSQTVVDSVRLTGEEKNYSRCLILDSSFRVIADSSRRGILSEIFTLKTQGQKTGHYTANEVIGFAQTVGYETYPGLGWYGVISQKLPSG